MKRIRTFEAEYFLTIAARMRRYQSANHSPEEASHRVANRRQIAELGHAGCEKSGQCFRAYSENRNPDSLAIGGLLEQRFARYVCPPHCRTESCAGRPSRRC